MTKLNLLQDKKGFTLIELLVVIAIIAVLAVIGFAVFNGLTQRGNDARRQADIKAIADAIEVKRGTNAYYQSVANTDFAAGQPPQEPVRTTANTPKYCYTDGTTAVSNPAVWTTTDCPTSGASNGSGWTVINNTTVPPIAGTETYFKICTVKQALGASDVICINSKQ